MDRMKNWQQLPDDEYHTNKCAYTFPDSRIFVVAYCRYLFGVRVHGYWKDSDTIELDWCCGKDPDRLTAAHLMMMKIVEKIPLWRVPSISVIKPWYEDEDFARKIDDLWSEALGIPTVSQQENEHTTEVVSGMINGIDKANAEARSKTTDV